MLFNPKITKLSSYSLNPAINFIPRYFSTPTNLKTVRAPKDPLKPYFKMVNENNLQLLHETLVDLRDQSNYQLATMLFDYMLVKGLTPLYKTLGTMITIYGEIGCFNKSKQIFESLLFLPNFPGPLICSAYLQSCFSNEKYSELDEIFKIIQKQYPKQIEIYLPYIMSQYERNNGKELYKIYKIIENDVKINQMILYTYLKCFDCCKMYKESIEIYQKYIKNNNKSNKITSSHFTYYIRSLYKEKKYIEILYEMMNTIISNKKLIGINQIEYIIKASEYLNRKEIITHYLNTINNNNNNEEKYQLNADNISKILYCYANINRKMEVKQYIKLASKYYHYYRTNDIKEILYSCYILNDNDIMKSIEIFLNSRHEIFGYELNLLLKQLLRLSKYELLNDIYIYVNNNNDIIFRNLEALSYILYSWSKLNKYELIDKIIKDNEMEMPLIENFEYNMMVGTIYYNHKENDKSIKYYLAGLNSLKIQNNRNKLITDREIENMLFLFNDDKNNLKLLLNSVLKCNRNYVNKVMMLKIYEIIESKWKSEEDEEICELLNKKEEVIEEIENRINIISEYERLIPQIEIDTNEINN